MNAKITYHCLVSKDNAWHAEQTPDQAYLGIGANFVAGYAVYRRQFEDRDGQPLTLVSVYGQHQILFGAYEFAGTV